MIHGESAIHPLEGVKGEKEIARIGRDAWNFFKREADSFSFLFFFFFFFFLENNTEKIKVISLMSE